MKTYIKIFIIVLVFLICILCAYTIYTLKSAEKNKLADYKIQTETKIPQETMLSLRSLEKDKDNRNYIVYFNKEYKYLTKEDLSDEDKEFLDIYGSITNNPVEDEKTSFDFKKGYIISGDAPIGLVHYNNSGLIKEYITAEEFFEVWSGIKKAQHDYYSLNDLRDPSKFEDYPFTVVFSNGSGDVVLLNQIYME